MHRKLFHAVFLMVKNPELGSEIRPAKDSGSPLKSNQLLFNIKIKCFFDKSINHPAVQKVSSKYVHNLHFFQPTTKKQTDKQTNKVTEQTLDLRCKLLKDEVETSKATCQGGRPAGTYTWPAVCFEHRPRRRV